MDLDAVSLERPIPDAAAHGDVTGSAALALATARYEFAARHVRPGRLLDIACGVGYGTRLLSDRAGEDVEALGVDRLEAAIDYAEANHASTRTRFACCDAMTFEDASGFDTVVSAVLGRRERRLQQLRPHLAAYYLIHPRSLLRRLASTLRHGFKTRYPTVALRAPG